MSRLGPGLIVLTTWAQSQVRRDLGELVRSAEGRWFGGQRNKDNTREEGTQHSWKRRQRRWVVPTTY